MAPLMRHDCGVEGAVAVDQQVALDVAVDGAGLDLGAQGVRVGQRHMKCRNQRLFQYRAGSRRGRAGHVRS